ncbi:Carboxypeptidase S1 [Termitomyces sp. J132]|nr:Carboxypeptidase S1 [Termitomyces sp. J132]
MSPLKFSLSLVALLSPFLFLIASTAASPAITQLTNFKSTIQDVGVRFVNNSGICETTPGVNQLSGYIDVGTDMSFVTRKSPQTAPFTLWLNGGPGCSSMIGLFQENGPCTVNADGKTTTLNPFSWNNVSNMIYIDQPIGTGFSHGTDTVNSTESAAQVVWRVFQVLFESSAFAAYHSREFIFATESYGGHYGPAFVTYFDQQNALIRSGALTGEEIVVSALMINNGWIDPLIQNKAYVDFAANAPGYGALVPPSTTTKMNNSYFRSNGCQVQEEACYAAGTADSSNKICINADKFCTQHLFVPAIGKRDPYDLRQDSSEPFPPKFYVDYLGLSSVTSAIGAEVPYGECPDPPFELFAKTGDDARTWLPQLAALADTGLKILIWAGDADIICNWVGVHEAVLEMDWSGKAALNSAVFTNMTLNGDSVAAIKNVGNFSFARVYAAGHEVPAFQPAAALEIFTQVIQKEALHSV